MLNGVKGILQFVVFTCQDCQTIMFIQPVISFLTSFTIIFS